MRKVELEKESFFKKLLSRLVDIFIYLFGSVIILTILLIFIYFVLR